MAGNGKRLQVVGSNRPDAETILEMAEPKRSNKLERWLSQQDEKTRDLFWETMKLVKARGRPFDPVYRSFMVHYADDNPPLGCLQAKRVVDAKLATNR